MLSDKISFNRNTIAGAGKALVIFQAVIMIIGTPLALYMFITTPEYLLSSAVYRIFNIRHALIVGLLVADLVLILVTIGMVYNASKGKVVYAVLLFIEALSYFAVAVFGWLFMGSNIIVSADIDHIVIYALYSGIILVIILFMVYGIWGRSKFSSRLVKAVGFAIIFLAIAIPLFFAFNTYSQEGSISGHIYQFDGTLITDEVSVLCFSTDPKIRITHGDPAPPCLVIQSHGDYKIDNLPASSYLVFAITKGRDLFANGPISVKVNPKQDTLNNISLVPGGSIAGRVTGIDASIAKMSDFKVQCTGYNFYGKTTVVAEDGTYTLDNVAPGSLQIQVFRPGQYYGQSEVTVKSNEITRKDFDLRTQR